VKLGWPFLAVVFEDGVGEMREVGPLSWKEWARVRDGNESPGRVRRAPVGVII
jgi:hypothetical protein